MPPKIKPKLKLFPEDGKEVIITEDNIRLTTEAGEPIDLEALESIVEQPVTSTPEPPSKVETFRTAGHLIDQRLKTHYPPASPQGNLFDRLDDRKQKEIEQEIAEGQITREENIEGIELTSAQHKLVDCICLLLHKNSQTVDPSKDDYYTGNAGGELVSFGGIRETIAPKLSFTLTELAKIYTGKKNPSGFELRTVRNLLEGLGRKKHTCIYKEIYPDFKGGGRKEIEISARFELLQILTKKETHYNEDNIKDSQRKEIIIVLNPIFRRQIETKYLASPVDIIARIEAAYGSPKIPNAIWNIRDYLTREFSNKRYTPKIGKERLFYLLDESYMKSNRKKKMTQLYLRGIDICQKIGLLQDYREYTNPKGEIIVEFTLNKDWLN